MTIAKQVRAGVFILLSFVILITASTIFVIIGARQNVNLVIETSMPFLIKTLSLTQESEQLLTVAPKIVAAPNSYVRKKLSDEFQSKRQDWEAEVTNTHAEYQNNTSLQKLVELSRHMHQNINTMTAVVDELGKVERRLGQISSRISRLSSLLPENEIDIIQSHELLKYFDELALLLLAGVGEESTVRRESLQLEAQVNTRKGLSFIRNHLQDSELKRAQRYEELVVYAEGQANVFSLTKQRKELKRQIQDLLTANSFIAKEASIIKEKSILTVNQRILKLLEKSAQNSWFANFLSFTLLGLGLAFSLAILLYFRKTIVSRLLALQKAILQHMEKGKANIPVTGNDEITAIARATKYFIAEISSREQALRASHQELEERVEKRTHQLALSSRRMKYLSARILEAQEEERRSLAAELHDNIGPSLGAIKFGIENVIDEVPSTQQKTLQLVAGMTKDVVHLLRQIQRELRPSLLDDLGFIETAESHCADFAKIYTDLNITFFTNAVEDDVPAVLKIVLFRLVQEGLNNIVKHGQAQNAIISLLLEGGQLMLKIEDDGCGIAPEVLENTELDSSIGGKYLGGLGLVSMRERVDLSTGELFIESSQLGTQITCIWQCSIAELLEDSMTK